MKKIVAARLKEKLKAKPKRKPKLQGYTRTYA